MKYIKISGGIFLLFATFIFSAKAQNTSLVTKNQKIIASIISEVKPALVKIHVVLAQYQNGREIKIEAVGSGVIINPQGYVVTNYHVVGKAIWIMCTLYNNKQIPAKLIGADPLADIAVVKLQNPNHEKFSYAQWGNSSKLKVGDTVFALGAPYAFSQSVTMGIVSNTGAVIPSFFWPFNEFTLNGENVGSIVKWITHDAPIYPGNSGGPLVNLKGHIVGINEVSFGLSGAIPSNLARYVAGQLIKYGQIVRAWLGFEIQPLLKISSENRGVLISTVIKGSPAQKAGLRSGDILLSLDNKNVTVKYLNQVPDFNLFVSKLPIGKEINMVVLRNDKEKTLKIVPIIRPPAKQKTYQLSNWGMDASDISFIQSKTLGLKSINGVLVDSVITGGPCNEAKPDIKSKDVIVKVNGVNIKNIKDLISMTKGMIKITKSSKTSIPVLVNFKRKGASYITVVNIGHQPSVGMGQQARQAWLGVKIQVLTKQIRKLLGLPNVHGVRITKIYPDSPARTAGLKVGYFITAINGQPLSLRRESDKNIFYEMIKGFNIGQDVNFSIMKGKKTFIKKVKLISSPQPPEEASKYKDKELEFSVRNFTRLESLEKKINKGVIVTEVKEGGWASLSHLAVGDIIISVNGINIVNCKDFGKLMNKIEKAKSKTIILKVERDIYTHFIQIIPPWETRKT
ncbi:MAG: PDZ domain-containing protein [Candidatus Omnitrophica bacterium]|jgi:serine protease Do|nr:PDZ domain-containing protein [Candidatus Omnitrophota bacterium]